MPIQYEKDDDNIVTLTLDAPGRPLNLVGDTFLRAWHTAVSHLEEESELRGVILASAKDSFIAGADLALLAGMKDPAEAFARIEAFKADLRCLETLGVPVAAALNGAALGGGFEVALAAHYRIALDRPDARFGLPEVTLGLIPAGGGIIRLTRMLGLRKAASFLLEGKQVTPEQAHQAGLVDALAAAPGDLLAQARAWIAAHPQFAQPWDREGYRIPGGTPDNPKVAQMISLAPAQIRRRTYGRYPAPIAILSAMVDGSLVDFETASRISSRAFARIVTGPVAKRMLQVLWFQRRAVAGTGWPAPERPNVAESAARLREALTSDDPSRPERFLRRVYGRYLLTGLAMLDEGVLPALIEAAGRQAGMPDGPLAIADRVGLPLLAETLSLKEDVPAATVLAQMQEAGREGENGGFYEAGGDDPLLWGGLAGLFPAEEQPPVTELTNRLLAAQKEEAKRCLQEGIAPDAATANVSSVFGWGFPPDTGGVIGYQ